MITSALRLPSKRRFLHRPTARLLAAARYAAIPHSRPSRGTCRRKSLNQWRSAGRLPARSGFSRPLIILRGEVLARGIPPPGRRRPAIDRSWRGC